VTDRDPISHRFPKAARLLRPREFRHVYETGLSKSIGPLHLFAAPNHLDHTRIGLSVSRRVGIAVRRNRIKRLLREAFRLARPALPHGYDLVINVRPHPPLTLDEYRTILTRALDNLDQRWRTKTKHPPPTGEPA